MTNGDTVCVLSPVALENSQSALAADGRLIEYHMLGSHFE